MPDTISRLIIDQNSGDNTIRKTAEIEFNSLAAKDPSSVAYNLIQLAVNDEYPVDFKQSCLLHLKRLVPKYWSMAFQSFSGAALNQDLKQMIRESLIKISTSSPYSKLRSGSAYTIVQIASADYPDEWPDLLNSLYAQTTNYESEYAMIGGLTVLNDLFDDLVTEEQFWEGGIGSDVTNHILQLLNRENLSPEIKTSSLKLYQNISANLQSHEAFSTEERKNAVDHHLSNSVPVLATLLEKSVQTSLTSNVALNELHLRFYIYKSLVTLISSFPKKVKSEIKQSLLNITLKDLDYISSLFKAVCIENQDVPMIKTPDLQEPFPVLTNLVNQLLQHLLVIQHDIPIASNGFLQSLINVTLMPQELVKSYEADTNTYVSEITGLTTSQSCRDAANELVSELNTHDAKRVFDYVLTVLASDSQWLITEACLYTLESLFLNDETELIESTMPITDLLQSLSKYIYFENCFVSSRYLLLLPKFFEKFESKLSINSFGSKAFATMIEFAAQHVQDESFNIVKVSTLVSSTLYKNLFNLEDVIEANKKSTILLAIVQIVHSLVEESEEDGLPALLESLTVATDIDPYDASKVTVADGVSIIDLIFRISFKDSANVQLTIDASESLSSLLSHISVDEYLKSCERSLPFVFNIMENEIRKGNVEYSPDLYLSLELLSIIIKSAPESEAGFPSQIFAYTFPTLKKLLLLTTDNQILQSGGDVFNNMLQRASELFVEYTDPETKESGMNSLLLIVSKFLSPELSDSAAINCGSIVLSIIEKFQSYLGNDFLSHILRATVTRLLIARETITIENLIMVFCKLVLNSPSETIEFLSNGIKLTDPKSGIEKSGIELVLPIWFESFEVTRGYEKITQNALALGKIFSLNNERVKNILVDGDIIPYDGDLIRTRSMAKSMPDQYTQISAPQKILKLLIGELEFQSQQPNPNDYLTNANDDAEEDGGEGWEDMDDLGVPTFEKLQSYVDSDQEEEESGGDDTLMKILVQFFKECAARNLGDFKTYYDMLDDKEKKTITLHTVF
jgi:hypothetical protein